jgi:hypothetical protein
MLDATAHALPINEQLQLPTQIIDAIQRENNSLNVDMK